MTASLTDAGGRAATAGRPRQSCAERGFDRLLVLLVPGLSAILLLFFVPFVYGLLLSFSPSGTGGILTNYQAFFADPYLYGTLITTLRIALPVSLFNVVAGVVVAYHVRHEFRGKRLLTTLLVIPITLGTVLIAEGLLTYLGPRGWLNRFLELIGVIHEPIQLLHNYWGVVFALVISGFPFAFLLILSFLSGIDPNLERAAATLGAGAFERFRRITLPLLAPGVATAFSLSFVLDFSVFPSAIMLGEPSRATRVISIAAYHAAFEQFDYSMASAIAMIMAAVELIVIGAVLFLRGRLYRGPAAGGGKG